MTLLYFAVIYYRLFSYSHASSFVDVNQISEINPKKYWRASDFEKKDWHDYEFMKYEASRTGPGEQGEGFKLTDPADIKLNAEVSKIEGLHAIVSDKISVNRSVPDVRHEK
jgi:hypothetical protein